MLRMAVSVNIVEINSFICTLQRCSRKYNANASLYLFVTFILFSTFITLVMIILQAMLFCYTLSTVLKNYILFPSGIFKLISTNSKGS